MSHLSYSYLMAIDRDAVLKAAVTVISRQPTAHLDEIARAAGISRASLHRIFPGREALIREVGLLSCAATTARWTPPRSRPGTRRRRCGG